MSPSETNVAIAPAEANRRALILPGGGMRVAYQAGALKALHDHGLRFSFADGSSGGTMNLAALLSGVTPDDLCRRWCTLDVMGFVSPRPLSAYLRFPAMGAFGGFDGIRNKVFPHLGIDLDKVRRAQSIRATFNVCDFDDKIAVAIPNPDMSMELLLAGISLPLVTPAVEYQRKTYTDAVWIRDSNLMETVRAGANEIWVIWCIGNTPEFKNGLIEQYVHMIEMSALGALHAELAEIAALNALIARGERPHGHDRAIAVHIVKPIFPIPLDTDFIAGRIDGSTLVDYGYRDAAGYLRDMQPNGVPLEPASTKMRTPGQGLTFREAMIGRLTFGVTDPVAGADNVAAVPFTLKATIDIPDVEEFIADRTHTGGLAGHLYAPRAGFTLPSTSGIFRLFSPGPDPDMTEMVYEMGYMRDGKPYYFRGHKHVRIGSILGAWRETTTLYVTVHETDAAGPVIAAGILRLNVFDFLALMGTLHAVGCERPMQRWRTVMRFSRFFARELWRTYVTRRRLG
jgi:predicted patatin/cPLA2 family phospholipase